MSSILYHKRPEVVQKTLNELEELLTDDNVGKVFKVVNVKVVDVRPRSKDGGYTVTLKAGRVTYCVMVAVADESGNLDVISWDAVMSSLFKGVSASRFKAMSESQQRAAVEAIDTKLVYEARITIAANKFLGEVEARLDDLKEQAEASDSEETEDSRGASLLSEEASSSQKPEDSRGASQKPLQKRGKK
jgi:hypothetical protein